MGFIASSRGAVWKAPRVALENGVSFIASI
jgi:hypothetical protein